LVVTEGYGNIKMSERTFDLLKTHNGKFVSINGATQIRAGVIRPEIVIPLNGNDIPNDVDIDKERLGIEEGSLVRVIRAPYFGKIGNVTDLPPELQEMESETMVRVAKVNIDGDDIVIPRSNLEMLETD
jgi:transcription antitermination factor NusG